MPTESQRRPIPSFINAGILLFDLAVLAGCFWLARDSLSWPLLLVTACVFAIVVNSLYALIHEAAHGVLFPNRRWNDFTASALALFFPASFHLIRQGHLGHHLRNRSDDEAFDLYFERDHWWWRWVAFYGILTGLYWLVIALSNVVLLLFPLAADKKFWKFDRTSEAFMEALNPSYRRIIQLECGAAICLHASLLLLAGIPLLNYCALYAAFGFTWSAMQYVHHYGTERHVTQGAVNSWVCRPIDWLWLNHDWHLTHHQRPTVPWIYLPEIARRENQSQGFLPWRYLRMWKGPRKATDRVQNKYAGRIIA